MPVKMSLPHDLAIGLLDIPAIHMAAQHQASACCLTACDTSCTALCIATALVLALLQSPVLAGT